MILRELKTRERNPGYKLLKNIPFHEARKVFTRSKITAISQAVQREKLSHAENKWDLIVKKLIRMERGDWKNFFKNMKSRLNIAKTKPSELKVKMRKHNTKEM